MTRIRMSALARGALEAVLANLSVERLRGNAEDGGRPALVPVGLLQDGLDVAAFEIDELDRRADRRRRARQQGADVVAADLAIPDRRHGALDDAAQLANVARPIVILEHRHGVGGEPDASTGAELSAELLRE